MKKTLGLALALVTLASTAHAMNTLSPIEQARLLEEHLERLALDKETLEARKQKANVYRQKNEPYSGEISEQLQKRREGHDQRRKPWEKSPYDVLEQCHEKHNAAESRDENSSKYRLHKSYYEEAKKSKKGNCFFCGKNLNTRNIFCFKLWINSPNQEVSQAKNLLDETTISCLNCLTLEPRYIKYNEYTYFTNLYQRLRIEDQVKKA